MLQDLQVQMGIAQFDDIGEQIDHNYSNRSTMLYLLAELEQFDIVAHNDIQNHQN